MNHSDILTDTARAWLASKLKLLGCDSIGQLNLAKCKAPLKDDLADSLYAALTYMSKLCEVNRDLSNTASELRDQVIDSQGSVVKLQEQLIESKNEQLQSLQATVKSSVQETVQAEFRTYSAVVGNHQSDSDYQPVTPATLHSVVRKVVEEEDRSRNIMVFGLAEEEDEVLSDKVSDVLQTIGEKPRVEACRVGKKYADGAARPVKVTLSSSVSVNQVLAKARNLKNSEKHKSVFLSPDRSYERRTEHRLLVAELKKLAIDEPHKKHFIRNGKVCSVES